MPFNLIVTKVISIEGYHKFAIHKAAQLDHELDDSTEAEQELGNFYLMTISYAPAISYSGEPKLEIMLLIEDPGLEETQQGVRACVRSFRKKHSEYSDYLPFERYSNLAVDCDQDIQNMYIDVSNNRTGYLCSTAGYKGFKTETVEACIVDFFKHATIFFKMSKDTIASIAMSLLKLDISPDQILRAFPEPMHLLDKPQISHIDAQSSASTKYTRCLKHHKYKDRFFHESEDELIFSMDDLDTNESEPPKIRVGNSI